MATSVVIGSGKVAETLAALMCTTGRRVALCAPRLQSQKYIRQVIQADSEQKIPMMFIDDLKHQQTLAARSYNRLSVNVDLNNIKEVHEIIDATTAEESDLLIPMHSQHVSLRLYDPILETKSAKIFAHVQTDNAALQRVYELLYSMGISVLSCEESKVADRIVSDMFAVKKSDQLTKLMTTLTSPLQSATRETPKNNPAMADAVGWQNSASAIEIAVDRIKKEHLIDDIYLNFIYVIDDCIESKAAGLSSQLFIDANVSAIIGPSCNAAALSVANLAAFYNTAILTWGLTIASALLDKQRYPTSITISPVSQTVSVGIYETMLKFQWTEFSYIYVDDEKCPYFKEDLEQALTSDSNYTTMARVVLLTDLSTANIRRQLEKLKSVSRIFVLCMPETGPNVKRTLMLEAHDLGMTNDEYLYLFAGPKSTAYQRNLEQTSSSGEVVAIWVDWEKNPDGRDEDARKAFLRTMVLVATPIEGQEYADFKKEVVQRMKVAPFFCVEECAAHEYQEAAEYADQLHDTVYLYALILNRTLQEQNIESIRNGSGLLVKTAIEFDGMSGQVRMNEDGQRMPNMILANLDSTGAQRTVATLAIDGRLVNWTYAIEDQGLIWDAYRGNQPLTRPLCGFTGTNCPINFFVDYLFVVIIVGFIIALCLVAAILAIYCIIKTRKLEQKRLDDLWHISKIMLKPIVASSKKAQEIHSSRSLQSGATAHTSSTRITFDRQAETARYAFFIYENEFVAARKHPVRVMLLQSDRSRLREMRTMEHENLNRFIGMCIDAPTCMSIWRYCTRGSLKDVIRKSSINMDGFFIYCLIKDVASGLAYLHSSQLGKHGRLTSSCCLISDRWQVKITDFGLSFLQDQEKRTENELLYTAPEILRQGDSAEGTREGDFFAIICSELVGQTSAWDLENRKEDVDEIVFMLKRGGKSFRPDLIMREGDLNPGLGHLIRECWEENPQNRPSIETINKLMRNMNDGRNANPDGPRLLGLGKSTRQAWKTRSKKG
ncbi:unnamed protein product [Caenorhabditis auriculariae]|uniref:guanylate cyclase n=1 Tax=Caenorhabditis auriculariae TaxID=2777116 RepID=A0A8S1HGG3_9PELO|nr:unnamed protein product [Caenorhabditis auriculariae]